MYQTTFIVSGEGSFPFNMLQHDRCFPARDRDVEAMFRAGPREVTLVTHLKRKNANVVSKAKWQRCGWTVVEQVIEPRTD